MELFAQWTALAALAVVVVQQILKLNLIPVYFANKYPVLANVILSIIASIVVNMATVAVALHTAWQWIAYAATVSVVAAITYNMLVKNSKYIQAISNKISKQG